LGQFKIAAKECGSK